MIHQNQIVDSFFFNKNCGILPLASKMRGRRGCQFNLFNDKHLMVEKLLKFFIGQINTQLLIRVFLENKMLKYVRQTCLFKNKHCVVE